MEMLHFVISHDERVELDGFDEIGVVAEDAPKSRLADLLQLGQRERRRLAAGLVPEAIAGPGHSELGGDDARERGAQQTAR